MGRGRVSRGARPGCGAVGSRAAAFEIEIEVFWCDRIARLPPGKRVQVWLTPRRFLALTKHPGSVPVGTGYTRACELAWFREDAFEALEGTR
jgi:hypothetical protein